MINFKEIKRLKDGEYHVVPESDYGKAEIWFKYGTYFLFSIPRYGGTPQFEEAFGKHGIKGLIATYQSWT